MPNLGVEGRTDAAGHQSFAASLQSRLLLTALAVLTPVLIGAGIWLLLASRLLRFTESISRGARGWDEAGVLYWGSDLRQDRSSATHRITRTVKLGRAVRRYRVALRARTTGRRWIKAVARRVTTRPPAPPPRSP